VIIANMCQRIRPLTEFLLMHPLSFLDLNDAVGELSQMSMWEDGPPGEPSWYNGSAGASPSRSMINAQQFYGNGIRDHFLKYIVRIK
jgi:hypothetical protein